MLLVQAASHCLEVTLEEVLVLEPTSLLLPDDLTSYHEQDGTGCALEFRCEPDVVQVGGDRGVEVLLSVGDVSSMNATSLVHRRN